jgi:hypothetical protein
MGRRRYEREYESEREYEGERRSRRYSYRRRERRSEERKIELVTFAALILLFVGGMLSNGAISGTWLAIIGGAILLGSAIYQTQRRWRVNPTTWVGGIIMLGMGIFVLSEKTGGIPIYFPMLIFLGIIVLSAITGEL